ncbi:MULTISPECIES: hypothetical protein [unclassified Variovorax]|uniref:hypothetical protein n=1 Tax=unclassified Variovorax TaxID=663243 RepID=UPI000838B817|nr:MULTISPECIES: hypothetical protein [unclassified Variovorax]PNG48903.1 hypothetical protein CHC06_06671 [Variovorax sp. B2]PNG49410.1 hypothetical protein CHC07_06319 [Variovorax sp. B4]VTV18283.1 hypothetical protein WDL1P2_00005 [Variovorax sp. WDL1]
MSSNPDVNPEFDPNSNRREPDLPESLDAANTDSSADGALANEDFRPAESLSNWFEQAVQPVAPQTAKAYLRNYRMMVDRAAAALNLDPDFVTIEDLLAQLRDDTTITPGTKNTYAAAITWALKQPDFDFSPAVRTQGLALVSDFDPSGGAAQEIIRNTRVSGRTIPQEDLGPLLNALLGARVTQQAWATKTTSWLNAGIATGARPGEWESAYWFDRDRRILRLPNAKLKKQAPFRWQHIPERLLNRADADLVSMAEADRENISSVVSAAKRHSELLARNLAFFDQAEAGTDASNAEGIDTLRRLRAWELHNAGLAWRDIEVPVRWVGAVDAHLTNLQQYLSSAPGKHGPPTFERYYDGCRAALRTACLEAFPDKRLYSLYDTRSTAAANMQATIGPEAAAAVMGHYMKRKRTIKANYAGADRAYRGAGRFAPGLADTQNQRDQAADRAAPQLPMESGGTGDSPEAPTGPLLVE